MNGVFRSTLCPLRQWLSCIAASGLAGFSQLTGFQAGPSSVDKRWSKQIASIFGLTISHSDANAAAVYSKHCPMLLLCLNQTSLIENVALMHCLPPSISGKLCVFANVEYLLHPFGWVVATRACPVVLQSRLLRRHAASACEARLRSGAAVYMSAEGRRRSECDGQLSPYRYGAARLALATGAVIIPVYFHVNREIMPPGEWRVAPGHIHVEFCAAVNTAPFPSSRLPDADAGWAGGTSGGHGAAEKLTARLRLIAEQCNRKATSSTRQTSIGSQSVGSLGEHNR